MGVFVYRDFEELNPKDENVYAYLRTSQQGQKWLVVLNFSGEEVQWTMPEGMEVEFWPCSNYVKGVSRSRRTPKSHCGHGRAFWASVNRYHLQKHDYFCGSQNKR